MPKEESLHAKFYRATERRIAVLLVLIGMFSGLFGSIVGVHYARKYDSLTVAQNDAYFWFFLIILGVAGLILFLLVFKLEKDADNLMDQIHEENK